MTPGVRGANETVSPSVTEPKPSAAFFFGRFSVLADRRNWKDLPDYFNPGGVFGAVHIIACGDDHTYETLRFGSLHIHPVRSLTTWPRMKRLNDAYVLAAGTRLLARIIRDHRVDLVAQIDATPVKYGVPVVYMGRKYGLPSIVTLCNDYDAMMRLTTSVLTRIVQRRLWPYVLTNCTKVRSKGTFIAGFTSQYGLPPSKVEIIPNKEDLGKFQAEPDTRRLDRAAAEWGVREMAPHSVLLMTCARLIEAKNVGRMLEAVAAASATCGNLGFLIVGEGPLRSALQDKAVALGIGDRVRFLGYLPHDELRLAYQLADIFLFPTLYEGHPRALLEAMLSGLPVIASNHGAVRDVVEAGTDGILVNARDVDDITDAIVRLASDPDLRVTMGRHPTFRPARYSQEEIGSREAAFYLETLAEHRDAPA